MVWSAILSAVAPAVIDAGVKFATSEFSNSQRDDAAQQYAQGTQQSADRLNQGYDQQLGYLEQGADELERIYRQQLGETGYALDQAGTGFTDTTRGAYTDYASFMYPQQEMYAEGIYGAANRYGDDMASAEQTAGDLYMQGADTYYDFMDPYMQSGADADAYMRSLLVADPNTLTASQTRALDEYRNDAGARLAASGLRGAGRAGVAAVNEGEAAMKAAFADQNQNRADSAAAALSSRGYDASGRTGSQYVNTLNTLGGMRYGTGTNVAANNQSAGREAVGSRYNLASDTAGKKMTGEGAIASNIFNVGKEKTNYANAYYGNMADTAASRYTSRADTAFGKAQADAAANQAVTSQNVATANANAANTGATLGRIGSVLNKDTKAGMNDAGTVTNTAKPKTDLNFSTNYANYY